MVFQHTNITSKRHCRRIHKSICMEPERTCYHVYNAYSLLHKDAWLPLRSSSTTTKTMMTQVSPGNLTRKKEEIKNQWTASTTSPPLLVCTLYVLATHVVVIVIFIVTLAPGAAGPAIIFIFSHVHFLGISWNLFSWRASSQESFQFL